MGMENIFDAEDDEHGEDDVAEDDQQGVTEVLEGHGFEHHGGDFVDGGEDEGIEEDPAEVFDAWHGSVDVFEGVIVVAVQPVRDVGAEEHHQRAGEGGDAQRVCKGVDHKAGGKADEILQRERQFQRQQEEGQQEERRGEIAKQTDMLADGHLNDEQYQKP